jgi:uncharacterized protein with von Willebrand factor type A (vWA) domain
VAQCSLPALLVLARLRAPFIRALRAAGTKIAYSELIKALRVTEYLEQGCLDPAQTTPSPPPIRAT